MQKKFNINTELARQIADKNMIKIVDHNSAYISPNNMTPSPGSSNKTPDTGNTSNYSLYDSPGSATSDTTIPFNDNTYDAISSVKVLSQIDEIPFRMINIKVSPGIIEKRKIGEFMIVYHILWLLFNNDDNLCGHRIRKFIEKRVFCGILLILMYKH